MQQTNTAKMGLSVFIGVMIATYGGGFLIRSMRMQPPSPIVVKPKVPVLVKSNVDKLEEGQYGWISYKDVALWRNECLVNTNVWTVTTPSLEHPVNISRDSNGLKVTIYEEYDFQKVDYNGRDATEVYVVEVSKEKKDFLKKPKATGVPTDKTKPVDTATQSSTVPDGNDVIPDKMIRKTVGELKVGETKWFDGTKLTIDKSRHAWINPYLLTENWNDDKNIQMQIQKLSSGYKVIMSDSWAISTNEPAKGLIKVDVIEIRNPVDSTQ